MLPRGGAPRAVRAIVLCYTVHGLAACWRSRREGSSIGAQSLFSSRAEGLLRTWPLTPWQPGTYLRS